MQLAFDWLLVSDVHLVSEGGFVYEICIVGEASLTYVLFMASYVILLITYATSYLWDMTFALLMSVLKVAVVRIVCFCNGRWLSCIGARTVIVVGHAVLVAAGRKTELASGWEPTCLSKLFLKFKIFIDRYMCPTIMWYSLYISLIVRWQCDLNPTSSPRTQFTFPVWGLSIVHSSLLIGLWKRTGTELLLLLHFHLVCFCSLGAMLRHLFLAELRAVVVVGQYAAADFSSSRWRLWHLLQ